MVAYTDQYENKVYMLPKHLDEKVAALHLTHLSVELETLSEEQARLYWCNCKGSLQARLL